MNVLSTAVGAHLASGGETEEILVRLPVSVLDATSFYNNASQFGDIPSDFYEKLIRQRAQLGSIGGTHVDKADTLV